MVLTGSSPNHQNFPPLYDIRAEASVSLKCGAQDRVIKEWMPMLLATLPGLGLKDESQIQA